MLKTYDYPNLGGAFVWLAEGNFPRGMACLLFIFVLFIVTLYAVEINPAEQLQEEMQLKTYFSIVQATLSQYLKLNVTREYFKHFNT